MMNWTQLLNVTRIRDLGDAPKFSRKRNEQTDEVGRTEYDRDYDRLVFSTPFKRLQDKAQVFPLEEHDGVRTRLTHSLEVSCVARGLAHAVGRQLEKAGHTSDEESRAIQAIAAACALAHDLGNPPFGHAGERAITEWFAGKKRQPGPGPHFFDSFAGWQGQEDSEKTQLASDFLLFDGNAHTQRLLSRLQVLSDQHGMNLTVATLASSCKYTAKSDDIDVSGRSARKKKHGFFASENQLMDSVFKAVGTNGLRHPIAHLVEAADDIVNRAADVEDGVRKRRLDLLLLQETFSAFIKKDKDVQKRFDKVDRELRQSDAGKWALAEGWASVFRTWAIGVMTVAAKDVFMENYKAIMAGTFESDLIGSSTALPLYRACKKLVEDNIFHDRTVIKRELMGKRIIHDLMDFYWSAISQADGRKPLTHFTGKTYALISPNYRHVFADKAKRINEKVGVQGGQLPLDYYRMQLLTDQISGMTDSYAVQIHRDLFNA